jgi:adenine-specific DNA methylase
MRYIGSKAYTLARVHDLISKRMPGGVLCDPFGGIGTVGSYFKQKGYTVWCGDLLTFAHCFQVARVQNNGTPAFRILRKELNLTSSAAIVELLNRARSSGGWFITEYAIKRRFFTRSYFKTLRKTIMKQAI